MLIIVGRMAEAFAKVIDLTETSGQMLLDRVFAALADPIRRAVLMRLTEGLFYCVLGTLTIPLYRCLAN